MFWRTLFVFSLAASLFAADAKIVLLAGTPSHPPMMHEYNAGMILLEKCLRQTPGVQPIVIKGGWPKDESVLNDAKAIIMYMDGGGRHATLDHLELLAGLMRKGVGIGALHYAVEVPAQRGGPQFLDWLGGYYETGYSKNPINEPMLEQASPKHPISAGWKSYQHKDEWYFRIRFQEGDQRVTPILTAMLPKDAPQKELLAWTVERKDGGRGFGFTGGHFHVNWGREEQRRMVVNGILWTAKVTIPKSGAKCEISPDDLTKNLDDKPAPAPRKQK